MAGLQTTDFRQQTHAVRPCNLAFDIFKSDAARYFKRDAARYIFKRDAARYIFKRDAARHVSTDARCASLLNAKLLNF